MTSRTPEQRAKKAAWNRAHRARKGIPAREAKTKPTVSVLERTAKTGLVRFIAQVRETDGRRTYLGSHATREQAEAACAEYLATGQRPAKKKVGPKKGQKHRPGSRTRWDAPHLMTDHQAKPLPTAELLARLGATHLTRGEVADIERAKEIARQHGLKLATVAKHPPTRPAVARQPDSAPADSAPTTPAAPRGAATWREIAARFA